jgi:reactive intermediate/imine deaminase
MMQCVETMDAPSIGDCSMQAVNASNGLLFISDVLPIVPKTDRCVSGGVREQMEQAFENLRTLLNASDSDLEHLVSVQILIPDKEFLTIVNDVYRSVLMTHKPARSIIPCGSLHPDALVEINAVAMISPARISVKWYEQISQSHLLSA